MGITARAEALADALRSRRAAIGARRQVDQVRMVGTLRQVARLLVPDCGEETVRGVADLIGGEELCFVLEDLERAAEADRTRLRALSVHEHLREPDRRIEVLERRHTDALTRIERHREELDRLDIDAFHWLQERHEQRTQRLGAGERLWRTVTLASFREQRAEAALRESLGDVCFDSAKDAYRLAEKGLRRAEAEAERVSHTAALVRDLVLEHATLTERVGTESNRRLRTLRGAVEAELVTADLSVVVERAPDGLRSPLVEAHAVEVRLRGWEDLEAALDASLAELEWVARHAYSGASPAELHDKLDAQLDLPDAVDHVVGRLAAFHDFERWKVALEHGASPHCWAILAGHEAASLDAAMLERLIPRLYFRPVCDRTESLQLEQ